MYACKIITPNPVNKSSVKAVKSTIQPVPIPVSTATYKDQWRNENPRPIPRY